MTVKISGTGLIGRNNENNITMNNDGSIFVGRGIVSPDSPIVADQKGKLPYEADKIIVSVNPPDDNQGDTNWIWLQV